MWALIPKPIRKAAAWVALTAVAIFSLIKVGENNAKDKLEKKDKARADLIRDRVDNASEHVHDFDDTGWRD